jgi:hypothetical protein
MYYFDARNDTGETLEDFARFRTTVSELERMNPGLSEEEFRARHGVLVPIGPPRNAYLPPPP